MTRESDSTRGYAETGGHFCSPRGHRCLAPPRVSAPSLGPWEGQALSPALTCLGLWRVWAASTCRKALRRALMSSSRGVGLDHVSSLTLGMLQKRYLGHPQRALLSSGPLLQQQACSELCHQSQMSPTLCPHSRQATPNTRPLLGSALWGLRACCPTFTGQQPPWPRCLLSQRAQVHSARTPSPQVARGTPSYRGPAPYQFTIRAAPFSAMNGRSPRASHTARQIQMRHWGMAGDRPPAPWREDAAVPPVGLWGSGRPLPGAPGWATGRKPSTHHRAVCCPARSLQRLDPEIPRAVAARGGWREAQIVAGD